MMRIKALTCLLALSACANVPLQAKRDLVGMARSDLIACAGVPDNVATLPDGEVLQWRQDQQVQGPFTIKGPMSLELDLSGHGTCHCRPVATGARGTGGIHRAERYASGAVLGLSSAGVIL